LPVALALGLVTLPLAKGPVDGALAGQARTALAAAHVDGVTVRSDWADLRLVGPAERRAAALAAVASMPDRGAVDAVEYVLTAGAVTPTPTPTPMPTATVTPTVVVDLAVRVSGAGDRRTVELSGTVAGEQRYAALRAAVRSSAPQALLVDSVIVAQGDPTQVVRAAYPTFLRVVEQACETFVGGDVGIDEQGVVVSGLTTTERAAATTAGTLTSAAAFGVGVRSTVKGPVTATKERLEKIKGLRGVEFERGSERLTDASRTTLDAVAKVLKSSPAATVQIRGHTDDKGPAPLNLALSKRRAAQVKKYLVAEGVPARRLQAIGFGETRPLRSNKTAGGRADNRRIEFVVEGS
jgi:outer membrane protein OmpA-like peptidoglycan-associated protein